MKILTLLSMIGMALFASSCRTVTPLDPMTMKPAPECLPGHASPDDHGYSGK